MVQVDLNRALNTGTVVTTSAAPASATSTAPATATVPAAAISSRCTVSGLGCRLTSEAGFMVVGRGYASISEARVLLVQESTQRRRKVV